MSARLVVLFTAFALPMTASADGPIYQCGLQDLVRRVEVVYTTPGSEVPCEVHYYKDTEAPAPTETDTAVTEDDLVEPESQ